MANPNEQTTAQEDGTLAAPAVFELVCRIPCHDDERVCLAVMLQQQQLFGQGLTSLHVLRVGEEFSRLAQDAWKQAIATVAEEVGATWSDLGEL
jgi:hypothetical protein